MRRNTTAMLTRFDRECGAWECCGYVHIADLKTCPICGRNKEKAMSYSFSIKADTKGGADAKVGIELEKIVAAQPAHIADRQAAADAARAFIDVLKDPGEDECVQVCMSGSLSWQDEGTFKGASVNVSAAIAPKA